MKRKRNIAAISVLIAIIAFAIDIQFKYFYGRSLIVERNSFTLNIGVVSVVALFFVVGYWVVYFWWKRAWQWIVVILAVIVFVEIVSYLIGSPIKARDRDFAYSIVNNAKEDEILFLDTSLKNNWRLESVKNFELIGESPFHNVFFYRMIGVGDYLVAVYIRPVQEVQIGDYNHQ